MSKTQIEWVGIDKVEPNPDNPRTISDDKMQHMMDSLSKFPKMLEYRPILVDRETGHIIGGNQRHTAAKKLGWKQVPVIYLDGVDSDKLRALVLKDNMNFGEWDFDKLRENFSQSDLISWGLEDARYVSFEEEDEDYEDDEEETEPGAGGAASEEGYEDNQIRKIVFNFNAEEYDRTLDRLVAYIDDNGLTDNSEALLKLIEAEGNSADTKPEKRAEKYNVYVISAGRYDDLPFSKKQKEKYIFCVKNGEGNAYKAAGCKNVFETGKLVESRNFALDHAQKTGVYCVQLSDDIKRARVNSNFGEKADVDLDDAINELVAECAASPYNLVGIPPTSNDFFAQKRTVINQFVIGDLFVAKPCDIRFDERLTLKEDYDFTMQHVTNGGVMRHQRMLFEFQHYSNKGGAVSYRDEQEEQRNIALLKEKWGTAVRDNPKRKNEILLKIK